jgi:hypothetical protein
VLAAFLRAHRPVALAGLTEGDVGQRRALRHIAGDGVGGEERSERSIRPERGEDGLLEGLGGGRGDDG